MWQALAGAATGAYSNRPESPFLSFGLARTLKAKVTIPFPAGPVRRGAYFYEARSTVTLLRAHQTST